MTKMLLGDIAVQVGGEVIGNPKKPIKGVRPFESAGKDHITYADHPAFLKQLRATSAGAVIVPRSVKKQEGNLLRVDNPRVAFAKVLYLFFPPRHPGRGIDPNASVASDLSHGKDVYIGPCVAIDEKVRIGDRVRIHAGSVIGSEVVLGNDVTVYPNVTIGDRCHVGSRVIIHSGTVIGSDGFGFAPDGENYVKIPQTGIVQIDDDVEIGANNTIDRATFGKTWIKKGVKTDNLVHIAHNVIVGEDSVLVAQVGIAGSTQLGRHAVLAGKAAVAGHLKIGDNVTIGPKAGVSKSIESGRIVSGSPEMPHRLWLKVCRIIPRLPDLLRRVTRLEKAVEKIAK
jgi:UDP-3-O-[3-hydroxymyristoyl] glucosamine N-acyltransferase